MSNTTDLQALRDYLTSIGAHKGNVTMRTDALYCMDYDNCVQLEKLLRPILTGVPKTPARTKQIKGTHIDLRYRGKNKQRQALVNSINELKLNVNNNITNNVHMFFDTIKNGISIKLVCYNRNMLLTDIFTKTVIDKIQAKLGTQFDVEVQQGIHRSFYDRGNFADGIRLRLREK